MSSESESWFSSITIYLFTTVLALIGFQLYKYYTRETWSKYGVKSPKLPWDYFLDPDFRKQMGDLIKKHGDIVCCEGNQKLSIFTIDFNLMRHILIKDFNNFSDRADYLRSRSAIAHSIFFAQGENWKRQRQIISPTFSSGKLKYISETVNDSAENLSNYFLDKAKTSELVPVKTLTSQFSSEIIAKTSFGLKVKFIGQETPEFIKYADSIFAIFQGKKQKYIRAIIQNVPFLMKIATKYLKIDSVDPVNMASDEYFSNIIKTTIAERKKMRAAGRKIPLDFLELLLRARDDAAKGVLESNSDQQPIDLDQRKQKMTITDEEIVGQSMLIIFAGMETTATSLQYMLYILAVHQDIQDKVIAEIDEVIPNGVPKQEDLNKLKYLEQVINETLRLFPPVPLINRQAKTTKTYDGVVVPKGTAVIIPFFSIFSNPKIFPNPEKFDPERFSPEEKEKRDPMSFANFGYGPRLCLGMRLAYLELKTAMVHIMRKVKVILNDKTQPKQGEKVTFKTMGILTPEIPIELQFVERNKN